MVGWYIPGFSWMGVFSTAKHELLDHFEGQAGWKQVERKTLLGRIPTDIPKDASCEEWLTDDQRRLFAFLVSDRFVVCELDQVNTQPSNSKGSVGRLPDVVRVGEKIQVRFDDLAPGTKVTVLDTIRGSHKLESDGGGMNRGLPLVVDNELRWNPIPQ